ncbi:hypothetical protein BGZ63DRAFT_61951 [Mariannaea sp. PMI_226]|nr:hypothetical protein BGZ63DRAFT_61951 [Mariannaea sp. PMI_226]
MPICGIFFFFSVSHALVECLCYPRHDLLLPAFKKSLLEFAPGAVGRVWRHLSKRDLCDAMSPRMLAGLSTGGFKIYSRVLFTVLHCRTYSVHCRTRLSATTPIMTNIITPARCTPSKITSLTGEALLKWGALIRRRRNRSALKS